MTAPVERALRYLTNTSGGHGKSRRIQDAHTRRNHISGIGHHTRAAPENPVSDSRASGEDAVSHAVAYRVSFMITPFKNAASFFGGSLSSLFSHSRMSA